MEQHSTLDHKEQQKSTRIFQEEFGQDYKVLGDSFMDWWNQTGIVWTYGPAVCLACERPGLWPEEYHLHGQAWRWVIDDVGLLFCGRNWQSWSCTWHHGFPEIPGHFKEERDAFCWQIKPWWSLDFPARQWSQAHLQVKQSLVEQKTLERPGMALSVARFKSDWKSLVGFKEGSCSMEAIKHHWARGFCTWRMGKDSDRQV